MDFSKLSYVVRKILLYFLICIFFYYILVSFIKYFSELRKFFEYLSHPFLIAIRACLRRSFLFRKGFLQNFDKIRIDFFNWQLWNICFSSCPLAVIARQFEIDSNQILFFLWVFPGEYFFKTNTVKCISKLLEKFRFF